MSKDALTPPIALDAIFRRNVQARPNAVAVTESGNAGLRELSYAALNDDVNAIASQIAGFQLEKPRNIALLLPNGVELAAALLAVMRAGHCAVPMPVLWRKSDLVRALRACEASALITTANYPHENLPLLAANAASEIFELSFPCAFGDELPDGILPLTLNALKHDFDDDARAPEQAVIATIGACADGIELISRNDAQWLAAGLSPLLTADIRQGDTIVSAVPMTSLAGIAGAFVPWLLTGGTLRLCADMPEAESLPVEARTHLIAHARVLPAVAATLGVPLASCLGVHAGSAAQVDYSAIQSERRGDLYSLGEQAAFASLRNVSAQCAPAYAGEIAAGTGAGPVTLELRRTETGALLVRGPQVPSSGEGDWTATTFEGQELSSGGFLPVTANIVSIGGLHFGAGDLERRILKAIPDAKIAQTADPLLGTRVVIWSAQPDRAARALLDAGLPRIIAHAVLEGERTRAAG